MLRSHGWGRWRCFTGSIACLIALALGGSALGATGTMTISTVAGDGSAAFAGDAGPATLAALKDPESVAATPDGGFLIADKNNSRIRQVAADGTITTVAGTGNPGYNGDGVAATLADLRYPEGVTALPDGSFLIADTGNCRIRQVSAMGTITTVAGTGACAYSGDSGPATLAKLDSPRAAVPTRDEGLLIADTGNHVVRRISPLGTISTVAGTGDEGHDGDGGQATAARLDAPDDVAPTVDGGFLIADHDRDVVRKVASSGVISTAAGNGSGSGDDDEGSSPLDQPADIEPLLEGGFLVADHGNDRVVEVPPDGAIAAFAGTGSGGFAGDGGPATDAKLDGPHGLTITADGDLLIADGHNHRVRSVDAGFVPAVPGVEPPGHRPDKSSSGPAPELGSSVVVGPAYGMVKFKLPGHRRWAVLDQDARVPVGSLINTLNGSVVLTSALASGQSQTASFWAGIFQVRQPRTGRGMTDIVLRGAGLGRCRASRRTGTRAVASRRRAVRRLWAKDDNGRFRSYGRDSVATTRGTVWLTADRCDGTLTRVKEGRVVVRRRGSRRGVVVKAGQRYLARSSR